MTFESLKGSYLLTEVHEPSAGRKCVHLLGKPPKVLTVSRAAVSRLNCQSRVIVHNPACIAARIGDVLILGFDVKGPTKRCTKSPKPRLAHRYEYQLTADERGDVLLAHLKT